MYCITHNKSSKLTVRKRDSWVGGTVGLSISEQAIITNKPQGLTEEVVCFMHEQSDKTPKSYQQLKILWNMILLRTKLIFLVLK